MVTSIVQIFVKCYFVFYINITFNFYNSSFWYLIYSLLLTFIIIKVLLPTCNETLTINCYILIKCMVPEVINNRYCLLNHSLLRNTPK